ncbi:PREDICTED: tRNA methyltransferase 10 homolog B-like isoform X1 [Branchiostoma belcheri]|uniref:tRNA (guanine(9)-N(1))-methyltransferase n=1 Tax=Branchiostoma belcheri TaxID=7741 RepID=A0A6P5AFI5_BRABE|nr:PREDICTED: tRNA methyltransferase 10 homolog B-like isoform X1 [Branchiostoma belcheri]
MLYGEEEDGTAQLEEMETEGETVTGMEHLSKRQRRKRLKYLRITENRRLHRKEKKKESQQRKKERTKQLECLAKVAGDQLQEGAALPTSAASSREGQMSKLERQKCIRRKLTRATEQGLKVVLDMSFGEKMTQKEASRLAGQVGRVHGANKLSERPFHVYLTSLMQDGMLHRECVRRNEGFQHFLGIEQTSKHFLEVFEKEDIVYLSPDSPNDLLELDDKKVYVIGGLVDETVQKNVTITQATEKGLQTAKLPIDVFMQRQPGSKGNSILTVNQVFEILLKFYTTRDWRIALPVGLPERKSFVLKPDDTLPKDVLKQQGVFPPGYDKDTDWGEETTEDSEEDTRSDDTRHGPDGRKDDSISTTKDNNDITT